MPKHKSTGAKKTSDRDDLDEPDCWEVGEPGDCGRFRTRNCRSTERWEQDRGSDRTLDKRVRRRCLSVAPRLGQCGTLRRDGRPEISPDPAGQATSQRLAA